MTLITTTRFIHPSALQCFVNRIILSLLSISITLLLKPTVKLPNPSPCVFVSFPSHAAPTGTRNDSVPDSGVDEPPYRHQSPLSFDMEESSAALRKRSALSMSPLMMARSYSPDASDMRGTSPISKLSLTLSPSESEDTGDSFPLPVSEMVSTRDPSLYPHDRRPPQLRSLVGKLRRRCGCLICLLPLRRAVVRVLPIRRLPASSLACRIRQLPIRRRDCL